MITSSSSTKIDATTANPLTLSLGSGAQQTFSSANPQLVRVLITVDSVTGGGSFVLSYDSATNHSSLDTPIVTVPEWSLAFLILVPMIPYLFAAIWRRRRLAGAIASTCLGVIFAVTMLASQVIPTSASPDVFYLHNGSTAAWYNATWLYRRPITIQSSQVPGSTNFSSFPVLIDSTQADWRDTTNGGKVSQADGGDILFTLSDGTTKLDHEIEKYVNTSGQLVAWVEVPTLYATRETLIFVYYGTSSAQADQWNITGTWDEGGAGNFEAVWHITEEVAGTGTADLYQDATGHGHHGDDLVTATGQTGKIDGGHAFNGAGDLVRVPDPGGAWDFNPNNGLDAGTSDFTISAWVYLSSSSTESFPTIVFKGGGSATNAGYWFNYRPGPSDDTLDLRVSNGTSRFIANSSLNIGFTTDTWHYVTVVFDRSAGSDVGYFYLNGTPKGSESSTLIANTSASGTDSFDFTDGIWMGNIDELRIASTVHSADWVATEFNNQSSPSSFYKIGPEESSAASPVGKTMNIIEGSAGSTQLFSSTGSTYWYTDQHWPIGEDDATIAAGAYDLNMYFSGLPGDSISVNDTFTEAANMAVTAHTPDEGISWTEVYDNTTATTDAQIVASTDIVRAGSVQTSAGQAYTAQPNPTGTSQSVSFTLAAVDTTTTNTRQVGLFARRTDNNNFYYFRLLPNLNAANSVGLFKHVGGSSTLLASVDVDNAPGDTFKLVVTNAAKKVYRNGVEILSSADNALTGIGTWGMFFGNFNGTGGNLSQVWEVTSFQAGDPSAWWDSAYLKRKQLTLTAPASGIASGYPVRLELDHAALVGAGDSQADGDDIRIVYWNGSIQTEVARALFNNNLTASTWNQSNTAILFKTQAAIAGSGSDAGYYMYYGNSGASGPPTGTLSSRYFIAESLSETQTSSATYATKASLTFTPTATTEQWVVLASWRQRHVGTPGTTAYAGESQILVNGGLRTGTSRVGYRQSGDAWKTYMSVLRITGTTSAQTVALQFAASGGTDGIDKARILAFMIPDPTSSNVQYSEALALTNDTVNPTNALTTTFSPTSAGNYVWIASGSLHEGPGGTSDGLFARDEASVNQQHSDESYVPQANSFVPFAHLEQRNLTTGSKSFILRHEPTPTTGSERQGLTQLLFRSDVFDLVEATNSTADNSTTSTSYVDKSPALTLTTASAGSNRDFIYLVVMGMYETVQNIALSTAGEVRLDTVQQTEDLSLIDRLNYERQMTWAYAETSTGGRTLNARYKASTGQTAHAMYGHIVSLRYKNPSMSLGSEQTNSVSITVRVHHTNTSGGDPQLITSASTTITSATIDPLLGLALGSGVQQTFYATDPRLLRLEIEVTSVSGGGSFVLDYDGLCADSKCSNLNTPVVTVPEPGLGLIGLALTLPALAAELRRRRLRRLRQEKRREGGGP